MADYRDEMNRRRARRAQQQAQARRQRIMLRIIAAVMVLGVSVTGLLMLTRNFSGSRQEPTEPVEMNQTETPTETSTEEATEPVTEAPTRPPRGNKNDEEPTTVIHLAAAGDLVVTDDTVEAGKVLGGYDYTQIFMDVAPVLSDADLTVLNFEGNLLGAPYGTESTSAPEELALALKNAGVDLVQMANSTAISDGMAGLKTSLEGLRRTGLEPMGAFADHQEFEKYKGYTLVDVQGIRIAFVAFTKGMGGLSLPAGSEDCVNLLYTDYATTYQEIDKEGITEVLNNVSKERPDLTIAMVHWGSEYKDMVTDSQEKIAKLMQDNGVDVVLGSHPHMLHRIEYDEFTGKLVAYSLGDFYSDAERAGTDYSIILDLEITRDNATGETKVSNFSYTPICTLTEDESPDGQRRVMQLEKAMDAYEDNFVDRVSDSVYEDLEYALTRIRERTTPPKPETEEEE